MKLQPRIKFNKNLLKDKTMSTNKLKLIELKKKRRSKEDIQLENKTLLSEVVLLEKKSRSMTKLSCNHKKNS